MMKISALNGMFCRLQACPLGRQVKHHRFWIGLVAGTAVVLVSSGSLSALAATGAGAVLLSVLPCALMMGVCMKMMHHGDGDGCDTVKKVTKQPSSPVLPAPTDGPAASPPPEAAYDPTTPFERPAVAQAPAPSTNLQE